MTNSSHRSTICISRTTGHWFIAEISLKALSLPRKPAEAHLISLPKTARVSRTLLSPLDAWQCTILAMYYRTYWNVSILLSSSVDCLPHIALPSRWRRIWFLLHYSLLSWSCGSRRLNVLSVSSTRRCGYISLYLISIEFHLIRNYNLPILVKK